MIEALSLPVKDPTSFIFFIFIPGFLIYYGLLLENKSRLRKISFLEIFFKTKVFGEHVDALIWSTILGVLVSIFFSAFLSQVMPIISPNNPLSEPDLLIKTTIVGSMSLALGLSAIIYSRVLNPSELAKHGWKRIIAYWFLFAIFVIFVEYGVLFYMGSSNPITGRYNKIVPYHSRLFTEEKVVLCNKEYENFYRKYIVVVNPEEHPITFWVKDDKNDLKEIYRNINSSPIGLVQPQILDSGEYIDFNAIIENCETKKEGWIFVVTSEGTIPLKYDC